MPISPAVSAATATAAFQAVQKTGSFQQATVAAPAEPVWFPALDARDKKHRNEGKVKD